MSQRYLIWKSSELDFLSRQLQGMLDTWRAQYLPHQRLSLTCMNAYVLNTANEMTTAQDTYNWLIQGRSYPDNQAYNHELMSRVFQRYWQTLLNSWQAESEYPLGEIRRGQGDGVVAIIITNDISQTVYWLPTDIAHLMINRKMHLSQSRSITKEDFLALKQMPLRAELNPFSIDMTTLSTLERGDVLVSEQNITEPFLLCRENQSLAKVQLYRSATNKVVTVVS